MDAFFNSFLLVAASEMGDKTQLLALILAARFKKPWTVMSGILVATLLNHWLASYLGSFAGAFLTPQVLKWSLFTLFIGFSIWILIPDKEDGLTLKRSENAFLTTATLFFLAEMGDKTQLATLGLGATYQSALAVTAGTTLGMLFSDGLAVAFGDRLLKKISMSWIRRLAATLFVLFAIGVAFGFANDYR